MRILNVIATLDPAHGGPVDGALRLTELWRAMGHRVSIATLDVPGASYLPTDPEVYPLGDARPPATGRLRARWHRYGYAPRMVPALRVNAPRHDVAVVHGLWNYSTMAARRALVGGAVPYFVFPHGSLDPWFKATYPAKHLAKAVLWPFNEGALMNNAAAALFTTEDEAALANRAFRPWRVTPAVVGFGSADAPPGELRQRGTFLATQPRLVDRRYLLFLSRIHPKKGCDLLIDAFARHAAAHPDLDLVFAGPDQTGWRPELERRAAAAGVAHRIHWTGMIAGDVKWGAYRQAEAFILPSHSENFGVVVAEALACGVPALITDKVNVWREVERAAAGLVAPDTPAGIDALIGDFLALPLSERAAMREAARRCYEANFRFEVAARRMIDLFERAIR